MPSYEEKMRADVENVIDDSLAKLTNGAEVDLSHHLSRQGVARGASPIKDLFKYASIPGSIMMAGGLPAPSVFPFETLSAEILTPQSEAPQPGVFGWLWKLFGSNDDSTPATKTMTIPKYLANPKDLEGVQLSTALQYGTSKGLLGLQNFVANFTKSVYKPLNAQMQCVVHIGNTWAWNNCLATFCNPGEFVITEDWTYTSAVFACRPFHVKPVGVGMDGQGMIPEKLENLLANWDCEARGGPRPHVMYIVPVGQNPCGTTMGIVRKKAIYEVCVKYDVIIVEDDPYFFLQCGEYENPNLRPQAIDGQEKASSQEFIDNLVPSFLRVDYQGRVIRLDTFSKTIAPGSRLGWYTCNPLFCERLERGHDATTQQPSGLSQALITQLLTQHWKYSGYVEWLQGLRSAYTIRRDALIDALGKHFDLQEQYDENDLSSYYPLVGSVKTFVGRSRKTKGVEKNKILFSFVAPTSGMFLWVKVHLCNHPSYSSSTPAPRTPAESLEYKLWVDLALAGWLAAPGWMFGTDPDTMLTSEDAVGVAGLGVYESEMPMNDRARALSESGRYGHLRISYSNVSAPELDTGLARFAKVMDDHFYPVS